MPPSVLPCSKLPHRLFAAGLLLLAGCSSVETTSSLPLDGTDPGVPGPYAVGVTTIELEPDERGRVLPVEVWYPAQVGTGKTDNYQLALGPLIIAELPSPLGTKRDADVDQRGAAHPIVVFSHGLGAMRIQSIYLAEHLASHGIIVAAPDHVGNTFADQIDQSGADPRLESARIRPHDVARTLDGMLAESSAPQGHFSGAVDGARAGVAGHSFGGFTTLRVVGATVDMAEADAFCVADPGHILCEGWPPETPLPYSSQDDRFIAALPQAPGGVGAFGVNGLDSIDVPMMIQAGKMDETTPFPAEGAGLFDGLSSSAYLLALERAGHYTFSDMCTLIALTGLAVDQLGDGCDVDNTPIEDAHPIIQRYAAAFLKVYLVGDDSYDYKAVLDPDAELPADTTLQVR